MPSPAELITQSGLVQVYLRSETLCSVANVMVVKNPDVMSESEQKNAESAVIWISSARG